MHTDEVDDSKVVENVQVSPKTVDIIEDIAVDFDTPIIDKIYCLLIVPMMTWMR